MGRPNVSGNGSPYELSVFGGKSISQSFSCDVLEKPRCWPRTYRMGRASRVHVRPVGTADGGPVNYFADANSPRDRPRRWLRDWGFLKACHRHGALGLWVAS